jgi:carbonic anhydrase/acetyltransferase-like protein (isoleucine patch superfamily)
MAAPTRSPGAGGRAVVRRYGEHRPVLGAGVFLAETCAVIGDVVLGDHASVWYGSVVRGDVNPIRIGARTNIQDNTVIHVTAGYLGATIGVDVTVGHGVILHACTIEDDCLIGMGAIVLDGSRVGRGSLVGAGALVTPGTDIPPGSLVLGSPAKVKRPVNEREREQIRAGATHYVEVAARYLAEDSETSLG